MRCTPLESWTADKIGRAGLPLTHADLEVYQLQKLRETLALARRSRFYRQRLTDALPDLTSLADLTRLPFTTADDLRRDPLQFLCVSQDDIHRVVTLDSSGTTGRPKRLYFTRRDQELTIDFFHVGMSTFTDPGDRVLILLPGHTPGSVGDLLATALERLGAVPIKHGPVSDPAAVLDVMRREAINVVVGVPVHLLALARQPGQPAPRLESVLFATDHAPDAIRQVVEERCQCMAFDHYGMTEMGLGGGVECEARRGYHLREADLLFEIVDPATGAALPDGEPGEIVFTTLTRQGMPLIRYRTGDVSRFIPGACPCGTHLKTLARVTHRITGRIAVGDGYLTMADLDNALFAIDGVLNFTATLVRENQRDSLHLDVQLADGCNLSESALRQALHLPAAFDLSMMRVNSIPLTMAKRTMMDRRNPDSGNTLITGARSANC
ncbi:MAG: phenylacetate--CoA ligase family protein [Anaerolineae bacterium]|nr:phenylacetate--CoA ligase family protein [Anaerolineae bacterium]